MEQENKTIRDEKGRFIKGNVPWSKEGLKNIHLSPQTEFKKGQKSWNKGLRSEIYEKRKCKCGCGSDVSGWNYLRNKPILYLRGHYQQTFEGKKSIIKKLRGRHNSLKTEFKKEDFIGKTRKEIYGKEKAEEITKRFKENRIKNGWFKNPEETKRKMSQNYKYHTNLGCFKEGDKRLIKENNPLWNNGSSFEPYGPEFNRKLKNMIRRRDNQVCINCGLHREKLDKALAIHHINYDKKCNFPQNLVSLCNKCHSLTNYNRSHWIKFFQSLLTERYGYQYSENGKIIINLNQ